MAKHKHIEPKPTTYGGVNFKSRLEARWAVFFDHCGNVLNWDYEPLTWSLANGWSYTPDFKIYSFLNGVKGSLYIEVKPTPISKDYERVLTTFVKSRGDSLVVLESSLYCPSGENIKLGCSIINPNGRRRALDVYSLFNRFDEGIRMALAYRFDLEE